MATWTTDQLAALEGAISQGALEVRYGDKRVTYRSLDEMMQLRRAMRQELYPSTAKSRRKLGQFDKGV